MGRKSRKKAGKNEKKQFLCSPFSPQAEKEDCPWNIRDASAPGGPATTPGAQGTPPRPSPRETVPPCRLCRCVSGAPYTVRAGDTFTSIAAAYGIATYELLERNPGVSPDNLMVGQVICVPFASSGDEPDVNQPAEPDTPNLPTPSVPSQPSQPSPPVIVVPTQPACPAGYTRTSVAAGETYADLLVKHNVSYRAMRTANPRLSPGYLIAGQSYCAPPHGTRAVCSGTQPYTVLAGETLDTIAADLGVTRGRLLSLNPTLLPSDFTQGAVICIP